MENKKVSEFKSIAKERGLHRYSKMHKAELLALLSIPISDAPVPNIPVLVRAPSQFVPIVKKEDDQAKSKFHKWVDWFFNQTLEWPKRIVNAFK